MLLLLLLLLLYQVVCELVVKCCITCSNHCAVTQHTETWAQSILEEIAADGEMMYRVKSVDV